MLDDVKHFWQRRLWCKITVVLAVAATLFGIFNTIQALLVWNQQRLIIGVCGLIIPLLVVLSFASECKVLDEHESDQD